MPVPREVVQRAAPAAAAGRGCGGRVHHRGRVGRGGDHGGADLVDGLFAGRFGVGVVRRGVGFVGAEHPVGHRLAVADDEPDGEGQHRKGDERRDGAARREGDVAVDDRDDQKLAIAHHADDQADAGGEVGRRPVADGQGPERGGGGRQHEAHRDLGHLDQQEGVEIERLADADLAELAEREDGERIACRPGEDDDQGVDDGGHDEKHDGAGHAAVAGRRAHPGVKGFSEPAQDEEGEDRAGDDEGEVGQRVEEHARLAAAEAGEDGRSAGELAPEGGGETGDVFRRGLGDEGDAAPEGEIFGRGVAIGEGFDDFVAGAVCGGDAGGAEPFYQVGAGLVILDDVDQEIHA